MRWSLYAIVVLMVIDITAWGVLWVWQVPPRSLAAVADAHMEPPERGVGRVYSRWNAANSLTMKGYRLSHGYFTFVPAKELDPEGLTAQRLAGVRWALNTDGLQMKSPYDYPPGSWIEVSEPMPRVRMVTHALVSKSVANDVEQIDIAETALLDEPVELGQGEVGTASIVTDRPGFIEVVTSSSSRQLLILSESYHPGWQATEDGRPIRVMRAYGDFQAVVVEPGQRRIVFRFRPASFVTGAWISSLGICAALVLFVLVLRFLSCPSRLIASASSQPFNAGRHFDDRSARASFKRQLCRNGSQPTIDQDRELPVPPVVSHLQRPLSRFKKRQDAVEIAWMRRLVRPGSHVLDIGANIGFYTSFIIDLGRVLRAMSMPSSPSHQFQAPFGDQLAIGRMSLSCRRPFLIVRDKLLPLHVAQTQRRSQDLQSGELQRSDPGRCREHRRLCCGTISRGFYQDGYSGV